MHDNVIELQWYTHLSLYAIFRILRSLSAPHAKISQSDGNLTRHVRRRSDDQSDVSWRVEAPARHQEQTLLSVQSLAKLNVVGGAEQVTIKLDKDV